MIHQLFCIFSLSAWLGTAFSVATAAEAPSIHVQKIESGWQFRQYNIGKWLPATVPGTVHTDLLDNGIIEDPFYRMNEQEVQWIDKINWEYQTEFYAEGEIPECERQQLVFYGLDTWADVFLNGEKIASADNMFRTWKIDVKGKLKPGVNTLNVRFYSPIAKGLEQLEAYGLAIPADNDYSQYGGMGKVRVSVYMRKAPYHFGWDWGPRLVPSGIWRPITLEAWNDTRVEDVFIRQPEVTKQIARLEAEVSFRTENAGEVEVDLLSENKLLATAKFPATAGTNRINLPFSIRNPRLWWSNGLGAPHLYRFDIRLRRGREVIASYRQTTGIRSLKLVREKEGKGETFRFELNGAPVFAKGANSIPGDVFLPRMGRAGYEKMVQSAAEAHMNMIRVWGGGIYEDDYFFELCDRYGILVWQDFAFACAMYPGNPEFLENVKAEAIDNIIRLRNHPSLALWCGNNEVDVAWARWGWKKRYSEAEQQQISDAYVALAHELLPELVSRYTDGDDYWPSSPMSGPEVDAHELRPATSGDNHYWGVWFEKHRFEDFEKNIGRFISEYGFQSFPEMGAIRKFTLPEDYSIESEVMKHHQRSYIGNGLIREYMGWYYKVPDDFEQFIYMGQVLQARGMKTAMQAHRRNMPYCMGSLLWQLNDCWPAASWSVIDCYQNRKAAWYAVREACKPFIFVPRFAGNQLELWSVNDHRRTLPVTYRVEIRDFAGRVLRSREGSFRASANVSEKITAWEINALLEGLPAEEAVAVIRMQEGKTVLDEQTVYFTEHKNLRLPENPGIRIRSIDRNGKQWLQVTAQQLACNVMFYTEESGTSAFGDNFLDLLPGKTYEIECLAPVAPDRIKTRHVR
ncbi:MAG: glycoside hydrolase family 2 protein [Culturomica sp.]|jgi:beta-mannosidase|nr:glycoside hydrolase family 2 protein [Culturomica sp.]